MNRMCTTEATNIAATYSHTQTILVYRQIHLYLQANDKRDVLNKFLSVS